MKNTQLELDLIAENDRLKRRLALLDAKISLLESKIENMQARGITVSAARAIGVSQKGKTPKQLYDELVASNNRNLQIKLDAVDKLPSSLRDKAREAAMFTATSHLEVLNGWYAKQKNEGKASKSLPASVQKIEKQLNLL